MLERHYVEAGLEGAEDCMYLTLNARPPPLTRTLLLEAAQILMTPLRHFISKRAAGIVQQAIEQDFNAETFKVGVRHAVQTVLELYVKKDWEQLKAMVSDRLLKQMQSFHGNMESQYHVTAKNVDVNVHRTTVTGMNLFSKDSVAQFDSARAHERLKPECVPYWAIVVVEVVSDVNVALWDKDANKEFASSTRKLGYWLFASGPLPKKQVPQLSSDWWLLTWF